MIRHLPWAYNDVLSPNQNRWMKTYILPSITEILPAWAKEQPKDFSLEYLLTHALESGWELTEEGWNKAHELGVAQRFETPDPNAPSKYEGWLKNAAAARQLEAALADFTKINKMTGQYQDYSFEYCKVMLARKGDSGAVKTNGKERRDRRYDPGSVDTLALKIRGDNGGKGGDDEDEPDPGYIKEGDANSYDQYDDPNNKF
jgi:hypothetical protein